MIFFQNVSTFKMDNKKTPKNPKNYIQYILVLYIDLCDKNIKIEEKVFN